MQLCLTLRARRRASRWVKENTVQWHEGHPHTTAQQAAGWGHVRVDSRLPTHPCCTGSSETAQMGQEGDVRGRQHTKAPLQPPPPFPLDSTLSFPLHPGP
jgi:hypothetical protein